MLRKIVNMIMGSAGHEDASPEHTHFEQLLERVRPTLQAQLAANADVDPLEALAREVMRATTGDSDPDMQASRAYFSVLVENDQLPVGEQLDENELNLLKSLLTEYFARNEQVRERANEVLALIERKFNQGAFTQAKILLQIFETDRETRLNNERNLFYEDMILRLGLRRRHNVPEREQNALRNLLADLELSDEDTLRAALNWLGREYYIELCFSLRNPDDIQTWDTIAKTSANQTTAQRLLTYVPPRRWRSPASLPQFSVFHLTEQLLLEAATRKHIQSLTRVCYFLLLASGDTGFEDFLYAYLEWCRDQWGVDAKRVLPQLHRRSVLEENGLQETLDQLFDEFFAEAVSQRLPSISRDHLHDGWERFIRYLSTIDINEVPPGHYDLGGLLMDQIASFKQPTPLFAFKVYRLT